MPKKARKDGEKTEEQRLVQQQHRAQAEDEMAKKKEEMLALFLQDKLQKEQRNSAVNLLKLHAHWRSILRQSRCAELREDMNVHRHTFERQLDDLDSITEKLVCDLQEVERHETHVQRCHMQHLDQLRDQQATHLGRLQQQWDGALQELDRRIHTEREQIVSDREQQQQRLQDLTVLIEGRNQQKMNAIRTLYDTELDQYEDDDDEDMVAAAQLEELQVALQCSSKSRPKQHQANKAVRRDPRNTKKTQRDTLSCIQTSQQHQDLLGAREEVSQKFYKLQDHMNRSRTAARKQFSQLTVQSDAAAKKLQAVIFKGGKVLRAADMCCRLEGALSSSLSSSSSSLHPADKPTAAKVCDDMALLTHRINDALQLRGALRTQAEELSRENRQLQLLLQQHGAALDGHPAPLYAAPVPTTTAAPAAGRGHTVIEAAHIFKHAQ